MLYLNEGLLGVWHALIRPLQYPLLGSERIYWVYLDTSLLTAVFVLARRHKCSLLRALRLLFPKTIYLHPSARVDYKYFYINTVLTFAIIVPSLLWITPTVATWTENALLQFSWAGALGRVDAKAIVLCTVIQALVIDFGITIAHYLEHKIPVLWEFHKVHHSAEVLTPMTVYRLHPVEEALTIVVTAGLAGLVMGLFQALFQGQVGIIQAYGVNIITVLFYMFGYHLRHSHVWIDYGPVWSNIFISPAQHQIHHSQDPKHYDKNMGFIFSFWDRLLGTYYAPSAPEHIDFGINRLAEHKEYLSMSRLFWLPFKKACGVMKADVLGLLLLLGIVALTTLKAGEFVSRKLQANVAVEQPADKDSVYLEDLTWMEIRDRLQAGTTIAIVPTAGTEQNGPHLILGKHHRIVRHTAGEIARRLGNALVAPVIDHVPEGDLDPPTEHMRFPGSLSLDVPGFEALLKATANSLRAHGFKTICFIGDHGYSQKPQQQVADELNRTWAAAGDTATRAIQVGDYYFNGEIAWLKEQGYSMDQIGEHAGLRDTAELMDIYPAGIRRDKLSVQNTTAQRSATGMHGDATVATAEIGARLIEMKVQAGLRQIRQTLNHPDLPNP